MTLFSRGMNPAFVKSKKELRASCGSFILKELF